MGTIVFSFIGICTHIGEVPLETPPDALAKWKEPDPNREPALATRVVVPDASFGYRWYEQDIPAHDAVLLIPKMFIVSTSGPIDGLEEIDREACKWRMRGVQLYATKATQNLTETKDSYRNLPSLTKWAKVLSLELDPRVVLYGRAAAVVDLYGGGTRDAYRNPDTPEAVHGTFAVQTDSQRLAVIRMRDQSPGYIQLQNVTVGNLTLPPFVFVMNTGRETDTNPKSDTPEDFLLHYFSTTWTPPRDWIPSRPNHDAIREANEVERALHKILPGGLTFGCSNSNYP